LTQVEVRLPKKVLQACVIGVDRQVLAHDVVAPLFKGDHYGKAFKVMNLICSLSTGQLLRHVGHWVRPIRMNLAQHGT
jgi:hypothetical protein